METFCELVIVWVCHWYRSFSLMFTISFHQKIHPFFPLALCNICTENTQIMLQKTWSNFTFSTLHTCEGPKRCPKANVQISLNVLYLPEYPILGEISCLALPEKSYLLWFGKICLATSPGTFIYLWKSHHKQWCLHLLAFLALRTTQSWSIFDAV